MSADKFFVDFGVPASKQPLRDYLNGLKGGYYMVEIEPVGKGRTAQQNRYYWSAVVAPLREAINAESIIKFSSDEVHLALRERFLPAVQRVNPFTGGQITEPLSTTKLSKQEFVAYIEKIAKWAAERYGITIESAS